ncbi:hypothetical protein M1567_03185 [Candidatus Marsarchaeota archaeon]|nr:hypothetical protein [Candidatus Marsarchaeota archaeon]
MGEYKAGVIPCERCGVATYSPSDMVMMPKGRAYCKDCAAKLGISHAEKNLCAICGKILKKAEVKMVLPSKSFGDGVIPLESRLACIECYSSMASRVKTRPMAAKRRNERASINRALHKSVVQQMM